MTNLRTRATKKQKTEERSLLSEMVDELGDLNETIKRLESRITKIKTEIKEIGLENGQDRFEGETFTATLVPRESWTINPGVWQAWLIKNGHADLFLDSIKVSSEFVTQGFGVLVKAEVGDRGKDVITLSIKRKE